MQELLLWPKEIISVRAPNSWVRCVFVAHYTEDKIIVMMMVMIVMISNNTTDNNERLPPWRTSGVTGRGRAN